MTAKPKVSKTNMHQKAGTGGSKSKAHSTTAKKKKEYVPTRTEARRKQELSSMKKYEKSTGGRGPYAKGAGADNTKKKPTKKTTTVKKSAPKKSTPRKTAPKKKKQNKKFDFGGATRRGLGGSR
ncbi:MAG: hypothetical protein KDA17_05700 [Candidatus Saccharibacteria bacterium]|nr:hypothetical protein [Candidatus Saccharibacteria bacterium]